VLTTDEDVRAAEREQWDDGTELPRRCPRRRDGYERNVATNTMLRKQGIGSTRRGGERARPRPRWAAVHEPVPRRDAGRSHVDQYGRHRVGMLMASGLVFFMMPGLALFYGGLVGPEERARLDGASPTVAIGVVSVLWSSWVTPWPSGPITVAHREDSLRDAARSGKTPRTPLRHTYPPVFMAFQMMFAVITPRPHRRRLRRAMHFRGYLMFIALWSLLVYCPSPIGSGGWGFLGAGGCTAGRLRRRVGRSRVGRAPRRSRRCSTSADANGANRAHQRALRPTRRGGSCGSGGSGSTPAVRAAPVRLRE